MDDLIADVDAVVAVDLADFINSDDIAAVDSKKLWRYYSDACPND